MPTLRARSFPNGAFARPRRSGVGSRSRSSIFWIAWILTRHVAFADDKTPPLYRVAAFGTTDDPVVAEVTEGYIDLLVPHGVDLVRIGSVRNPTSCGIPSPDGKPKPIPDEAFAYAPASNFAEIDPEKLTPFKPLSIYGKNVVAVQFHCRLDWKPQRTSFATYRVQFANSDASLYSSDDKPKLFTLGNRLKLYVESTMDEPRMSGVSVASVMPDERTLSDGDTVFLSWTPVGTAQNRDVILIVIGALIALGAALAAEGLRGQVEIAIEQSNVKLLRRQDK